MLQVMEFVSYAWDVVTPQTIRNCFRKAGWDPEDYLKNYHPDEAMDVQVCPDVELPDGIDPGEMDQVSQLTSLVSLFRNSLHALLLGLICAGH